MDFPSTNGMGRGLILSYTFYLELRTLKIYDIQCVIKAGAEAGI
jgi:hypothetical protein